MYRLNRVFISSSIKFNSLIKYNIKSSSHNIILYQLPNKSAPLISYNVCTRYFHTSKPDHAIAPLVWALVRPVLKVFAILFGRSIRKWWQNLPKHKKKHFIRSVVERKYTILGYCLGFAGVSYSYYSYHVEEHPITKRKRFVLFSDSQVMKISQLQISLVLETHKDDIIPIYHPSFKRVQRVVERLFWGNADIPQVRDNIWSITVIDKDSVDAFVFPNGHIFVFSGILKECKNDDQLGVIIGHEMAHAILGHSGEKLSNSHVSEMLLMIPLVILWSVFPDTIALIYQIITSYFLNVQIELPYSRILEKEADEYGLQLAAKSCFDVRQAITFWKMMSETDPLNKKFEFLSSHPSHEHRQNILEKQLPLALKIRKLCKCPDLL